MKNLLNGFILLTAVFLMSSCSGNKRCGGGGWYGDRNLSFVPTDDAATDADFCRDETTTKVADYEPAAP